MLDRNENKAYRVEKNDYRSGLDLPERMRLTQGRRFLYFLYGVVVVISGSSCTGFVSNDLCFCQDVRTRERYV